ncbi:50S ribosomal protein L12 [candidate division MSBL1 archaeon SCGC-AAA259M10]|uniref:Large ribosomal subunit protein P1 n=4 Tax=candidate division MSBL1 TaxID=215777 RepID=A0A133U3M1_9EURY|nr:50S ribosomal protein L12 [candidate division MSBL1 archaeon SCGC-AAA259D14]KXA99764.1 50S ribosomal protein L12 [candidate division MSBL1 archaeon SCGC-AAA259M10]
MEYIYAAMILHSVGQEVTEENISKLLEAAGVEVDEARVKALTTALEDVNIDEAIETAAMPAAAPAPETSEEEEEKKKAEKEEKEEEKEEEEEAPGLGGLFD